MLELEDEVRYRLVDSEETRKKYPFPFCLEIGYRIEGKKVEVLWKVINTGTREMHFQIGAHPAFYYPDYDAETMDVGISALIRRKVCTISLSPRKDVPLRIRNICLS